MGIFKKTNKTNVSEEEKLTNNSDNRSKKITEKINVKNLASDLLAGTLLTKESFQKQLPFFLFIVILILTYVNNNFLYESDLKHNAKAKVVLTNTKYESLTISRELMEMGRRSKIQEKLSSIGSDLEEPRTPAIIVKD